jgi:hypothetical protein
MNLPFPVPDWLPWWALLLVVVPALLYALAFLFMPFSVIGVKGRIDVLEARLDEIQHEIRQLSLRMPEPGQPVDYNDVYEPQRHEPAPLQRAATNARPPIPPAPHELNGYAPADRPAPPPSTRPGRREPRLDWPR